MDLWLFWMMSNSQSTLKLWNFIFLMELRGLDRCWKSADLKLSFRWVNCNFMWMWGLLLVSFKMVMTCHKITCYVLCRFSKELRESMPKIRFANSQEIFYGPLYQKICSGEFLTEVVNPSIKDLLF